MKISRISSHIVQHGLSGGLGYFQQYCESRSAHLVEAETDEGVTGWGECFGPGRIAIANKAIVERVIQPMLLGMNPLDRDGIWHTVYNLLRDHGRAGMPMQALSGVDIALWDIAGKVAGVPLYRLLGGAHRRDVAVYAYGMMLRPEAPVELAVQFHDEAAMIRDMGFTATKMKVGPGPRQDFVLVESVRKTVGDRYRLMVDANHRYTTRDAMHVGQCLEELDVYWFEEPAAPEDLEGCRDLRARLRVNIGRGESGFNRWGWRRLPESRGLDIEQPEVCAPGGTSECLQILALCHSHFTPVNNHVWGAALSVAANFHLLAAMPPLPGGLHPWEPMLEFDTTENLFLDDLITVPLRIQEQVARNLGRARVPEGPRLGVEPDRHFLQRYANT